jgi:hypothetical protein
MGLFDKAKAYMTGSHAKVTLDMPTVGFPSMPIAVKVTAAATLDFEYGGVFVDISATEDVSVKNPSGQGELRESHSSYEQQVRLAPAGAMKKGDTQEWVGTVILPPTVQPTFKGKSSTHSIKLRGRLETKGNDPDSGFVEIRIGAMS